MTHSYTRPPRPPPTRRSRIHDTFLYPPASAAPHQAFPFAAMAMALNGAASVMLLCIPAARRFILMAALG
jgi:hypothetical protein